MMFVRTNGIPIGPISSGSKNSLSPNIDKINPGKTTDTILSKITVNPMIKINQTNELFVLISGSEFNSDFSLFFLSFDLNFECFPNDLK